MENIIILLACIVMTTAAGQYKFFKMHKTEQIDIQEYDIGTKALDKSLSSDVHEIRGKFANCGKIYSRNMFNDNLIGDSLRLINREAPYEKHNLFQTRSYKYNLFKN